VIVEEILLSLYRIEIPLPPKSIKIFEFLPGKGHRHSLLIDTGMNRGECKHDMFSSLKELDVDLEETDFLSLTCT